MIRDFIGKTGTHQDVAIPIAWPDQTARGDEKWMQLLKRIGVVKNLNFKVGHAAIVLINRADGDVRYFDFGRYITPRGYGRARSAAFDPRLNIETKASFDRSSGRLINLEEILSELAQKEEATHGGGRLLCSIAEKISFKHGVAYAEQVVDTGPILYGALARNNNSCSRYVAQILTHAMRETDPRIRKILYPEFIKASPTSNVVNAATAHTVYCYTNGVLDQWSMKRFKSLCFQVNLLRDNFTSSGAQRLAADDKPGQIGEPARSPGIPRHAQWLGGIGEGKWFCLDESDDFFTITRYDQSGKIDYMVLCIADTPFNTGEPYHFSYDIHHQRHVVVQGSNKIVFFTQIDEIAEVKQNKYAMHS